MGCFFICLTAYELTLLSAPRAMQSTAMGMLYLMDGISWIINLLAIYKINWYNFDFTFILGTRISCIGFMLLAIISLTLLDKRFNLGLRNI